MITLECGLHTNFTEPGRCLKVFVKDPEGNNLRLPLNWDEVFKMKQELPSKNTTMLQSFHWYTPNDGSFWNHTTASAEKMASLGINAVWLPPASKGSEGINSNGYDSYDLFDLGEFMQKGTIRTKFGTKQDYIDCVKTLQSHNIKVYADVVLNHKGGADGTERILVREVDPQNRNHFVSRTRTIAAHTIFNFPGRKNKYSSFQWDYRCFTGVDYDQSKQQKGIFKILNDYGDHWQQMVGTEMGNFDYLMFADIEYRNRKVVSELKRWGKWMLEMTGVDGVRLDAVKHMPVTFINEWLDYMRKLQPSFQAIGEFWEPVNLAVLTAFIAANESRMPVFDAKLHQQFHDASIQRSKFDLRTMFDDTLVQALPDMAMTIVDNHDTQPLQEMDMTTVEDWFKPMAYACILLREAGTPCIFHPDLFGAEYTGKTRTGDERSIVIHKTTGIEQLIEARRDFAYGKQTDYFQSANCIGWLRHGIEDDFASGCAVLISTGKKEHIQMNIGTGYAKKRLVNILDDKKTPIEVDDDGWASLPVEKEMLAVYLLEKDEQY